MVLVTFGDPRLPSRFWEKAIFAPTGCWLWTGGRSGPGYGVFWWHGKLRPAHRVAYEQLVGAIPDGLDIDHVRARGCVHRHCVNPAHLEPVTRSENNRRADMDRFSVRTHCKWGHPFDEANTYLHPRGRQCRECVRRRKRELRERRTEA